MSPCPYCGSEVILIDSALIYNGRGYGPVWVCSKYPECDAYVGCHKGTTKPLGRLANRELRTAKMAAHKAFDVLWQRRAATGRTNRKGARTRGYYWLAEQLKMPRSKCHIGMMDVNDCIRVVKVCQPYLKGKTNGKPENVTV